MRLAFVSPEFVSEAANFDGGLANYLLRINLALQHLGHEGEVFVASDRNETIQHQGITVHRVSCNHPMVHFATKISRNRLTPLAPWWWASRQLHKRLQQRHNEHAFDAVQYASCNGMALHRLRGATSVVRISGYQALWDIHYGLDPNSYYVRLVKYIEDYCFRNCDAMFGPGHILAQRISSIVQRPSHVIETPFILDTRAEDASHADQFKQRQTIIFFGSIGSMKGCLDLAAALPHILTDHPDVSVLLVGKDRPLPNGSSMLELLRARSYPAPERLHHFGSMPHTQLYPLIRQASLAVLPSRIDNFPNTAIEAMALGTPVLGTKGTSFEQLVDDNVSGFLCERANPASLRHTIARALAHPDLEAVGKAAKERIAQLTPEKVVHQLVAYYQTLIDAKKRHRLR